jgi:hypothetical protein
LSPIFVTTRFLQYSAMAVYPFVFIKRVEMQYDKELVNHELIHHRQQLEMGILPFYIAYLFNYLYNLIIYRKHYAAYRNIIFEREAFAMDKDLEYLSRRKFWNFLQY